MHRLVIISTVGASLLTNYARYVKIDQMKFLDSIGSFDEEEFDKYVRLIYEFLTSDPETIWSKSAELSAINRILQKELSDDIDEIELMFLVSDTPQGRMVCEVLKQLFTKYHKKLNGRKIIFYYDTIKDLSYSDIEHVTKGLPNLMILLSQWIRSRLNMGARVILNVTGGFKAEGVYAAFVGFVADIPVYYIHEKFKDAIKFPPIPNVIEEFRSRKEELEVILHFIEEFYRSIMGSQK